MIPRYLIGVLEPNMRKLRHILSILGVNQVVIHEYMKLMQPLCLFSAPPCTSFVSPLIGLAAAPTGWKLGILNFRKLCDKRGNVRATA